MAPRQGAAARALLCSVWFLLCLFVYDTLATVKYDRDSLLSIRGKVCGLSFVLPELRCNGFNECPTRGSRDQQSRHRGREQREGNRQRSRYIRYPSLEPQDAVCLRRKRRHRGRRGGLLVRLRRRSMRIPLPSIYLANMQSLRGKVDDLLCRIQSQREARCCSVYCLVETWLTDSVPDSAIQPPGFAVYRSDRVKERTGKSKGGAFTGVQHASFIRKAPRLFKTHLPAQFYQNLFGKKTARLCITGDWSSYFQRFLQGKVVYGSWFDHVTNWWKKKETYSNLHFVLYEDLVKDTKREIDRLCSFLGLFRSSEEKDRIAAKVQFDQMKTNPSVNLNTTPVFNASNEFIRKGKVGNWKNYFTVAQNEEFNKDSRMKFSRDELFEFKGIWMNHYYTDNWENVQSFQAKSNDIVITGFPDQIVYVARNPKDVMVSYYHFDQTLLLHPEPGDWSSYFQRFLQGKVVYESWFDHFNNWWKKKETYSNLHFVFYEDLVKDTKREIDHFAAFSACFVRLRRKTELQPECSLIK
ncbi:hypothetical protein WMY93_018586 [Mugilogobius chulae]|uniref:Sulfotransferase n=1 Tax=Mugilogobius chulae TaxID=88201 RepID=A0AAW0NUL9_9GOBI